MSARALETNTMPLPRSRVQPLKCVACGSTWFQEVQLGEPPVRPTNAAPDFQLRLQQFCLLCLCGEPVPPYPLDSNAARTPGPTGRFLNSLIWRRECLQKLVPLTALQSAVSREQWPALQEKVRQLETLVAKLLAKQRRAAARPKTRGREYLEGLLQEKGFTSREARTTVAAIFQVITEGIKKDGRVETPLGIFKVEGGKRSGHKQILEIVFEPYWEDGPQ